MNESDRPTGILTDSKRAFVRGQRKPEASQPRAIRHRIRKRVRNALLDFGLLYEHLEYRDRRQILDRHLERTDRHILTVMDRRQDPFDAPPELYWDGIYSQRLGYSIFTGGLRATQAFTFLLLREFLVKELGVTARNIQEEIYAELARQALLDAFGKSESVPQIDVDVSIEPAETPVEHLREQRANGEQLDGDELARLIAARAYGFTDGSQPPPDRS